MSSETQNGPDGAATPNRAKDRQKATHNTRQNTYHTSVAQQAWRERALAAIEQLAETGAHFTAWDIAQVAGEPVNFRQWGFLFGHARHRGLIHQVAAVPSRRPTSHGSLVYVWAGIPALRAEGER